MCLSVMYMHLIHIMLCKHSVKFFKELRSHGLIFDLATIFVLLSHVCLKCSKSAQM